MITGEEAKDISSLHRRGMSIRAISRELKMSRKTVRKYVRYPDLAPVYRTRAPRPSKLDPFKGYSRKRIAAAAPPRLTGVLLDRLIHHVSIFEMNAQSYRLAQSQARKATKTS